MARTKQTAGKSTGGAAPKKALAPLPQLTLPVTTAPQQPPEEANTWCAGCDDGGKSVDCDTCPRHVCATCIEFPEGLDEPNHTINFYCPRCWLFNAAKIPEWTAKDEADRQPLDDGNTAVVIKAGVGVPYRGFFRDGKPLAPLRYKVPQTLRAQWPLSDTTRLVVLSLRLDGTPLLGDAATLIAHHFAPYYQDAMFLFESLNFDLDTKVTKYDNAVDKLAGRLESYAPVKIMVVLTDHSTPDEGCLHISQGGAASADAGDVLPRLIPARLQQVVRQARTSLLVLQVCSALNTGPARQEVADFVAIAGFQHAIGFTTPRFLPAAAHTFLQDVAHHFFITGHAKKFQHILATHYELGMHTDIIMYFPTREIYRYCWTHPIHRPHGHRPPPQCPMCLTLTPFDVELHTEKQIVLKCSACQKNGIAAPRQFTFDAPLKFQRIDEKPWVGGKKAKMVQGVWYGEWLCTTRTGNGLPVYHLSS
ncbi:hypothetical protein C8F04DRAFT_1070426 [Mycena alexandri]|uniref:Uncharacterized protein n=1 Tax=Mycena alexandri TaxID=1745969 RepID=A0AAD6X974_9AGAR|nr:hypothetical protein C8F04DRAFT_1070426 [Mycena alexandri]